MSYLDLARQAVGRRDTTETRTPLAGASADATTVWQAALDRLEGDPRFPPNIMTALREATVQLAADEFNSREFAKLNLDGRPVDCIEPPDPCSRCGSLMLWENALGDWRCLRCDPPEVARRLLETGLQIRRRAGLPGPPGAVEMLADLKKAGRVFDK